MALTILIQNGYKKFLHETCLSSALSNICNRVFNIVNSKKLLTIFAQGSIIDDSPGLK